MPGVGNGSPLGKRTAAVLAGVALVASGCTGNAAFAGNARWVSNGSGINLKADKPPMWKEAGTPVAFFVGDKAEPFGAEVERLTGPYPGLTGPQHRDPEMALSIGQGRRCRQSLFQSFPPRQRLRTRQAVGSVPACRAASPEASGLEGRQEVIASHCSNPRNFPKAAFSRLFTVPTEMPRIAAISS